MNPKILYPKSLPSWCDLNWSRNFLTNGKRGNNEEWRSCSTHGLQIPCHVWTFSFSAILSGTTCSKNAARSSWPVICSSLGVKIIFFVFPVSGPGVVITTLPSWFEDSSSRCISIGSASAGVLAFPDESRERLEVLWIAKSETLSCLVTFRKTLFALWRVVNLFL